MPSGVTVASGVTAIGGAFASSVSPGNGSLPKSILQSGVPLLLPPSGFFANNGVYVVGQAPTGGATATFSATSGAGVTMTMSAATLLGTAADVGRILTILDTTYKFATITAQSSTTVATVTITGTLSGVGPFANNTIWLSGTPTTNTTAFSVPIVITGALPNNFYANCFMNFPAGAIFAGSANGWYFAQSQNAATVYTVFNNLLTGPPNSSQIPATPTAFATTGPGAFSQTTGSFLVTPTIGILPANTMGPNGLLHVYYIMSCNNNANTKNTNIRLNAISLGGLGVSTAQMQISLKEMFNRGVTNRQVCVAGSGVGNNASTAGLTLDTTTDLPITMDMETLTAATDWVGIEAISVMVYPG